MVKLILLIYPDCSLLKLFKILFLIFFLNYSIIDWMQYIFLEILLNTREAKIYLLLELSRI